MQSGLIIAASVIVGLFGAALLGGLAYAAYQMYAQIRKLNESLSDVPRILNGIWKICEALVASSSKMDGSIEKFQSRLFEQTNSKDGIKKSSAFSPYDEEDAERASRVIELMEQNGLSESEAVERVKSETMDPGRVFFRD